jgi:hypothetical protein
MSRETPQAVFEHAQAAMLRGDLFEVFACLDVNDLKRVAANAVALSLGARIGGDVKTTSVVLCLMVLISTVVFAQQPAKPPKNPKPAFKLTISTDHETVAPGSKVIVTVHLTNLSDRPLSFPWLNFGGPDPSYRLEVRNSQGQMAPYMQDYGKRLRREPPYDHVIGRSVGYTVEKGETVTEEIEVTERYDLSTPGKYAIRAFHPDREANVDVQSNTISLTVTE